MNYMIVPAAFPYTVTTWLEEIRKTISVNLHHKA